MSVLEERLAAVNAAIADAAREVGRDPGEITLEAATKTQTADTVRAAIQAGVAVCGENRVQELVQKLDAFAYDGAREVHFIGHLQTNKVRQLVATRRIALIESIDSERLLRLVDAESERAGIVSKVLMQVHVAREETKFGFLPEELLDFFRNRGFETLKATHICGLMGMASNTDDTARIEADFKAIADLRKEILDICPDLRGFDTLSMGMSHDYPIAIKAGANLVRVGTAIFGDRF